MDDWCTSEVEFRAKANWSRSADEAVLVVVVVVVVVVAEAVPNGIGIAGVDNLLLAEGSRRSRSRS